MVCFPQCSDPVRRQKKDSLTARDESKEFEHPRQTVFEVEGKAVNPCGDLSEIAVLDGGVVVASPETNQSGGAHLGIEVYSVRGDGVFGGVDTCRPFQFDCTSLEASATPDQWSCQSRNEFDVYHGISTLTKVDPLGQPLCSVFEDGTFEDSVEAEALSPSAEPGPGSPGQDSEE